jgi:hypothetical protein
MCVIASKRAYSDEWFPAKGYANESPGWRSCQACAGDSGSLITVLLLVVVLVSTADDPVVVIVSGLRRTIEHS